MGNVHDYCVSIVERSTADSIEATNVCGICICNSGASSTQCTLPVGMVMCTWAVKHIGSMSPSLFLDLHWHVHFTEQCHKVNS